MTDKYAGLRGALEEAMYGETGKMIAVRYTKTRVGIGFAGGPAFIMASPGASAGTPETVFQQTQALSQMFNVFPDLLAERDALRGALKQISEISDKCDGGDWDEIEDARDIARLALQQGEQQ